MATSVPIEEELVPYLGTALTGDGITAWNESTSAGVLFQYARPAEDVPAISIRTEEWRGVQNYPGIHRCKLVIESQGTGAFANHMTVIRYLRNQKGERGIFQPLSLTSYRIESIEDETSLPEAFERQENWSIGFRSRHALKVKETNP